MSEQNNPKVKILVSCHKEVPLPSSDIYLPVQVGSLNKPQLRGMQPDREGENIANRNFTFCELTAQYWAWKNLDADFYGLCHYRRYFCFDGIDRPTNDHAQIEVDSLSEYSFRDFHINEDSLIYDCLKTCDIVVPVYWDVTKAATPDGIKSTVQEHMVSFGLYANKDVDLLRSIIKERQPDYLKAFDGYMSGNKYLGYNCFIMRKELFHQFCKFEFDVLLEFDCQFDYSNITSTRKRICGYFGEVLFSVFVEKLIQEKAASINQVPLVFFSDTTYFDTSATKRGMSDELIRIIWRYRDRSVNAFEICLENLLDHLNPTKQYELTVLYDAEFILDEFNNIVPELPSNLLLKKAHWSTYPIIEDLPDLSIKDLDLIQPLLLPWMIVDSKSALWIDGLAIFNYDPAALIDNNRENSYYGIKNVLLHRELNKPQTKHFLGEYSLSTKHGEILDSTVMVINFAQAREEYSLNQIYDVLSDLRSKYHVIEPEREIGKPLTQKKKTPIAAGYLLENQAFRAHVLSDLGVGSLPFTDASHAVDVVDTAAWLNEDWSGAWLAADSPTLVYLEYGKPPTLHANQRFRSDYWKQARKSDIYEVLLAEVLEPEVVTPWSSLFPDGSKRKKIAKSILGKFGK